MVVKPFLGSVCFFLCVAGILTGCAHPKTGFVDKNVTDPGPEEAIVVLGVAPEHYRLAFFEGFMKGTQFEVTKPRTVLAGTAEHGYVVGRVRGGTAIGLESILRQWKDGKTGRNFNMCGRQALVYPLPAGKVIYLGTMSLDSTDASLNVKLDYAPQEAQQYLREAFPNLHAPLTLGSGSQMELVCTQYTSQSPVFIHSYSRGR